MKIKKINNYSNYLFIQKFELLNTLFDRSFIGLTKPKSVSNEEINMIEYIVEEIIDYIKDEIQKEHKLNGRLLVEFKKVFDKENESNPQELIEMHLETFLEFIKEIKKIRKVYQRGKSFVNNHTKGRKKGFNFRWFSILKSSVEREGITPKIVNNVREHLIFIRKYHSERTYYRHLKRVRELGILISFPRSSSRDE